MTKEITPTNIENEHIKGRISLWLEPEDLEWLAKHCCCTDGANKEHTDRCLRLRFRASAALHKAKLEE